MGELPAREVFFSLTGTFALELLAAMKEVRENVSADSDYAAGALYSLSDVEDRLRKLTQ